MKQPKILFVDHTAVMGGAELSLLDLAAAYSSTCKVLLFEDGILRHRLQQVQVEVSVVEASDAILNLSASGGLNSLKIIPELWKLAAQIVKAAASYDLIVANSQKAFIVSALAVLQGSPPVIWHLRDILTAKHFSPVNRFVAVQLANRFAAKVLVNSQATGQAFIAAGGRAQLCHVVYNGFKSNEFDAVDYQETLKVRSQLGINENVHLVGLFSRLSYWKGQHILLKAVAELPEVQVILVGEALFGEQDYVSEIKLLATKPELAGRVHWLGFRDDIPTLMKACDIIAHTSTEPEPFGRVIVEGQLAQRPVIASAAGGALELVDNGHTGYLFPPQDVLKLSGLIKRLISDRTLAKTMGQKGYESAKANFALETILQSFAQAISI
ncbi:MAG: glycosyltransferase family 4 protein [Cyanobacteria bacterium P01_G01_bin.67]